MGNLVCGPFCPPPQPSPKDNTGATYQLIWEAVPEISPRATAQHDGADSDYSEISDNEVVVFVQGLTKLQAHVRGFLVRKTLQAQFFVNKDAEGLLQTNLKLKQLVVANRAVLKEVFQCYTKGPTKTMDRDGLHQFGLLFGFIPSVCTVRQIGNVFDEMLQRALLIQVDSLADMTCSTDADFQTSTKSPQSLKSPSNDEGLTKTTNSGLSTPNENEKPNLQKQKTNLNSNVRAEESEKSKPKGTPTQSLKAKDFDVSQEVDNENLRPRSKSTQSLKVETKYDPLTGRKLQAGGAKSSRASNRSAKKLNGELTTKKLSGNADPAANPKVQTKDGLTFYQFLILLVRLAMEVDAKSPVHESFNGMLTIMDGSNGKQELCKLRNVKAVGRFKTLNSEKALPDLSYVKAYNLKEGENSARKQNSAFSSQQSIEGSLIGAFSVRSEL